MATLFLAIQVYKSARRFWYISIWSIYFIIFDRVK